MTTRTLTVMTDDYDGAELKPGQGHAVRFSLEGRDYEIDLSDKNLKKLQTELSGWIDKARPVADPRAARGPRVARAARVSRSPRRSAVAGNATAPSANAGIREWARANGFTVSARGRISTEIRDAFAAAT